MVKTKMAYKPQDRMMRLLSELRECPNEEGIRKILNASEDARHARIEYFGLGKAVKRILNRELTEREKTLVRRLA
jgi:Ca2+-binding EF-hand superfamily protein